MDEENLSKLLDIIAGRGPWAILGGGFFHTYPGDPEKQGLHDACEELARRGAIYAKKREAGHCVWCPSVPPPREQVFGDLRIINHSVVPPEAAP